MQSLLADALRSWWVVLLAAFFSGMLARSLMFGLHKDTALYLPFAVLGSVGVPCIIGVMILALGKAYFNTVMRFLMFLAGSYGGPNWPAFLVIERAALHLWVLGESYPVSVQKPTLLMQTQVSPQEQSKSIVCPPM